MAAENSRWPQFLRTDAKHQVTRGMTMRSLFSERRLGEHLGQAKTDLQREVDSLDPDYLLKVSEVDLEDHLVAKYALEPPELLVDDIYQREPKDIPIDPGRTIGRGNSGARVSGTAITVCIPFRGSADLLRCQPSTFNYNPPRGKIVGDEVQLTYELANQDGEYLRQRYERDWEAIQKYISWVCRDVESFNESLPRVVRKTIERRKKKLLVDRDMSATLGIPMKRRKDAPQTYSTPEVRRKATINRPTVPMGEPFRPEPTLADTDYKHILKVVQNMVDVMERSPQAFVKMGEEDLRWHFLVQLNGQYEGQATGETFNFSGKTDILIRDNGKNVFIAECKFWKGPKALTNAIGQLLGYASWRDTKTAILVFNRNENFSAVLEKIPVVVKSHPCFKREIARKGETIFRYLFHQPNDPSRELLLTILAFDVPT